MESKYLISALLLVFWISLLALSTINTKLLWDENAYLANARNTISESNYTEDFRSPLINLFIGGAWLLTGENIFVAKLVIMAFAVLSVYIFYLISLEYFSNKKSLLLAFSFAFSSLILFWSFRVYTDIPGMAFILSSFYFLLKGQNNKNVFLSGLFSGLAFLMRFPLALFPVSVIGFFILRKEFNKIIVFLLPVCVLAVPWLAYNYSHHNGDFLFDIKNHLGIVDSYTISEPLTKHLINLFLSVNILAFLLPLGLYIQIKKRRKLVSLMLLYLIIFAGYFLFFTNIKISRYFITVLPFLYLIAGESLEYFKKIDYVIVGISFILAANILWNFMETDFYCNPKGSTIDKAVEHVCGQHPEKVASNFWPYFGYSCNSKITSLWSDNLEDLLDGNTEYLVYSPQHGDLYSKTLLDSSQNLGLEKTFTGECGYSVFIYKVK